MVISKCFLRLLVLSTVFTITTTSHAGFGDDGTGCISQDQWVDGKWDIYPNRDANGYKTWVKSKTRFRRDERMGVQFMLFNTELTYRSGRKVRGNWKSQSRFTQYCLGGCGPNCDAAITLTSGKSRSNRLLQIGSKDCFEHDVCVILNGANSDDVENNCSDEWLDSVDNHVATAIHGNSPSTPQFKNIDFNRYLQCAVKWNTSDRSRSSRSRRR